MTTHSLKNQVLKELGVTLIKTDKLGYQTAPYDGQGDKTYRMLLVEKQHDDTDIRELLVKGSVREVGKRLGLHPSTVSRWREWLQIAVQ